MIRNQKASVAMLACLSLAGLGGCQRRTAAPAPPIAVQVVTLTREHVAHETRFSATVRERRRVELSFKVPGTVAKLLQIRGLDGQPRDVQEGDPVPMDAERPLAYLDDCDYQRQLATARERLAQVQARERSVLASVTAARSDYERTRALREQNAVAEQAYDDSLARKNSGEAQLEAARREVSAAMVAVQQAEEDLRSCTLLVPLTNATVSRKYVEPNERVMANRPAFQLMDLSQVRIVFGAADVKIGEFQLGQTVTVVADALRGERFAGQVTKIAPAANLETRTFEVEVAVDQPKGLKPGMAVTVVCGRRQDMLLLPMTALQRGADANEFLVYTVVDEKGQNVARERRVCLDGMYDNRVRVSDSSASEINAGDVVVVSGANRLTDGQAVRVLAAAETDQDDAV